MDIVFIGDFLLYIEIRDFHKPYKKPILWHKPCVVLDIEGLFNIYSRWLYLIKGGGIYRMAVEQIYDKDKYCISLFKNLPDAILIIDGNLIIDCNNAAVKMFGYNSKEELIGINPYQLSQEKQPNGKISSEMDKKMIYVAKKNGSNMFEWVHRKKDGTEFYAEVVLVAISLDEKKIVGAIIRDITEKKEALSKLKESEKKIKNLAIIDKLTGLYNRSFFVSRLSSEIEKTEETTQNLSILFIDVDGFKSINDNLGHISGDQTLQMIAKRIKKCMDKNDIVARVGGDEFVILSSNIKQRYDIAKKAEKIMNRFKKPIYMSGYKFYITVSIGIVLYPFNGQNTEVLIKNADIAMHKAKKYSGNRYEYYTSSLHKKAREEFIIENGLRKALEQDEFSVYYQPIVDLETKKLVGAEALIRWKHPKYGYISPNKFIPIAENRGLIGAIGKWVLKTACLENKKWQAIGFPSIFVAVNISVRQLEQDDFIDTVKKILSETKLDPKYLELEITESISMENVKDRVFILKKLKDLGVRLSIDDFGTGFSSLSQLKKLCISKLKIDRSFINDINIDSNNTAIVSTIIAIAKKLNLNVVAEGVETKEQLDFLNMEKCDMVQGYLYSPPVPANSFKKLFMNFANSNK